MSEDITKEDASEEKLEDIFKSGSIAVGAKGQELRCLSIIGQIEGHYALGEGQKAPNTSI